MWGYGWIIEPRKNIAVFQENISIDTGKNVLLVLAGSGIYNDL